MVNGEKFRSIEARARQLALKNQVNCIYRLIFKKVRKIENNIQNVNAGFRHGSSLKNLRKSGKSLLSFFTVRLRIFIFHNVLFLLFMHSGPWFMLLSVGGRLIRINHPSVSSQRTCSSYAQQSKKYDHGVALLGNNFPLLVNLKDFSHF